jgi:Histidine phosphatase superfamily (branch 1)
VLAAPLAAAGLEGRAAEALAVIAGQDVEPTEGSDGTDGRWPDCPQDRRGPGDLYRRPGRPARAQKPARLTVRLPLDGWPSYGWLPGRLSDQGRQQARQLGRRRTDDGVSAVFSSDLARAAETAAIAFAGSLIPVLHDWRLRECDYGARNGSPAGELYASRPRHPSWAK